MSVSQEFLVM